MKKIKRNLLRKFLGMFTMSKNTVIIGRIWHLSLRKYKYKIILVLFLLLLFAAVDGYTIKLIQPMLDKGFIDKNINTLKVVSIEILILFIVKAISLYYNTTVLYNVSLRISKEMRNLLFRKILRLDMGYFEKNNSGTIVARVAGDTTAAGELLRQIFTVFLTQLATVISMLAVMIYTVPRLSILAFLALPCTYYLIKILNKRIRRIYHKASQQMEGLQSYLIQIVQNIPILKIYTREKYEEAKSNKLFHNYYKLQKKTFATQAVAKPIIEVLTGVIMAFTMFAGGYFIAHNLITLGEFVVFFAALFSMYRPLKQLSGVIPQIQTSIISAERFFLTYDAIADVEDLPNAKDLTFSKGLIEFKNVGFSYKGIDKQALNNISFKIFPGQVIALVGHSGAGKTTIVKLLSRFYDATSGEILVDNQNIIDVKQRSLRKFMSMVTQDVLLFDDTIKNNIAYGSVGDPSDVSIEEIINAAKKADANDFIMDMPKQYNTTIGERGIKLSGGQKQRISIARAVLKNSPILLLDEATSSLDTQSEKLVQQALYSLMKNRTTIVIAHRLSTIINADKILVIDKGKLIEEGTHEELLKKNGKYKALYNIQFMS